MTDITKHDSKEERKGDDCEDGRICFLEHWNTICVHNLLEGIGEFIRLNVSRLLDSMIFVSSDFCSIEISQIVPQIALCICGAPKVSNEY